jgi:hypothetical protein
MWKGGRITSVKDRCVGNLVEVVATKPMTWTIGQNRTKLDNLINNKKKNSLNCFMHPALVIVCF